MYYCIELLYYYEDFYFIPSNEEPTYPIVRLRCDRRLYSATLNDGSNMWTLYLMNVKYYEEVYWSTFWLDVVFDASQTNRLSALKHCIYVMNLPNQNDTDDYIATPSLFYRGYFCLHRRDRPNTWLNSVFYLCPLRCYENEATRRSFLFALTDEEVERLNENLEINREYHCARRLFFEYFFNH